MLDLAAGLAEMVGVVDYLSKLFTFGKPGRFIHLGYRRQSWDSLRKTQNRRQIVNPGGGAEWIQRPGESSRRTADPLQDR
jgi:hypothetical protein